MAGVNRPLTRRTGPRLTYLEPISLVSSEAPTTYVVPTTYPVAINERNIFDVTLPALQAEFVITERQPSGFDAELPSLQAEVYFGGKFDVTLPTLQAEFVGTVLPILRFDVTLPALQAEFSGTVGGVIGFDVELPSLTAEAVFGGYFDATLPALQAEFSGTSGGVLNFDVALPSLQAEVALSPDYTLRFDVALPALQVVPSLRFDVTLPALTAHVVMSEVVSVTYEAYAINLTTGAVSHYTNYPFDNILRFGSKYYGVKSDGLFEIGGALDLTLPIDAHVKTFLTNLGSKNFKRVPYVYASGRSDGGVIIGVTADEGETYEYESDWGEIAGSTNHRTTVGKGVRGVYYSIDVKNVNGGSLELDEISAHVAPTQRAV